MTSRNISSMSYTPNFCRSINRKLHHTAHARNPRIKRLVGFKPYDRCGNSVTRRICARANASASHLRVSLYSMTQIQIHLRLHLRPIFPQPLSSVWVVRRCRGHPERLPHPRRVGAPSKLLGETKRCRNTFSAGYLYCLYRPAAPSTARETTWHALCLRRPPSPQPVLLRACLQFLHTRTSTRRQTRQLILRRRHRHRKSPSQSPSILPAGASTIFVRCSGHRQRRKTTRREKPGATGTADARLTSNSIPTSRPTSMEPLITR